MLEINARRPPSQHTLLQRKVGNWQQGWMDGQTRVLAIHLDAGNDGAMARVLGLLIQDVSPRIEAGWFGSAKRLRLAAH